MRNNPTNRRMMITIGGINHHHNPFNNDDVYMFQ